MHAYLGDRSFANLVKAYIAANPSDQRSARWFGRHMPAFIAKSATFAKHPEGLPNWPRSRWHLPTLSTGLTPSRCAWPS